jgi:precorrin-2 C20-methyltransferase/precorrin-3B C17-methyltransferase
VVIGRAAGTPGQQITVTTLGGLDPEQVDMQCLLIVGSSQTRILRPGRVVTPRRYPG